MNVKNPIQNTLLENLKEYKNNKNLDQTNKGSVLINFHFTNKSIFN